MMIDYYKWHKDIAAGLSLVYNRMDNDKDLAYGRLYKMVDLKNNEMKDVYNVTLNDAQVFGSRTVSLLSSVEQTLSINGKGMTPTDTSYAEEFVNAALWEADQRLIKRGFPTLFQWMCHHIVYRGRISSRNLVRVEKGKLLIDIFPQDARYVTYQFSQDGLDMLGYETRRSAHDIEVEYKVKPTGTSYGQVVDVYSPDKHLVTVYGKKIKEESHDYGEVPCIYQMVAAGSLLQDQDALEHQGESIYSLNREIYKQLNEVASVLKTQNMQGFLAGLQYESALGEQGNVGEMENPRAPEQITAVEMGGGFKPVPTNDMKNATRQLLALLERRAQWGSISSIDYGNLTFPLSAVAIARLKESKDQIFWPRLDALAIYYRQLARQILRQYIKKGVSAELGEEGKRRKFDPKRLDQDYTVEFNYFSQSPEEDMANTAHAGQQLAIGIPRHYVYTHTMNFKDPTSVMMQGDAEEAELLSPDIKLRRHIVALYRQDTPDGNTEAEMLWPTLKAMLVQKMNPAPALEEPPKKKQPPSMAGGLKLLEGEGGGGRRQLGRDQLEASEEAMVTEQENEQSNAINRVRREQGG